MCDCDSGHICSSETPPTGGWGYEALPRSSSSAVEKVFEPKPPSSSSSGSTHLTAVGVLAHGQSARGGEDGGVVVHVEDADGDRDVTDHPRVVWRMKVSQLHRGYASLA